MSTFNDGLMKAAGVTLVTEERLAALEALETAAREAVDELNGTHRQADDGIGCVDCYPSDGRWPCASSLVVADLVAALDALEDQP